MKVPEIDYSYLCDIRSTSYLNRAALDSLIVQCFLDKKLKCRRAYGICISTEDVSMLQFCNKTSTFQVLFSLRPDDMRVSLICFSKKMIPRYNHYRNLCRAKENNHDRS